ncbi:DNA cytosine methyltransferase [Enterococcus termitis]
MTTVQKDNYVVEESGIYTNDSPEFHRGPLEGISRTLKANKHDAGVTDGYRIRKLTPLECWRLMDFEDEDFYKAQAVCSNSQLYKQAGNSIVRAVLMAIFRQMFSRKEIIK